MPSWPTDQPMLMYPAIKNTSLEIATRVFMGAEPSAESQELIEAFEDAVRAGTGYIRRPVPLLPTRWNRGLIGRQKLEKYFRELIPAKRASADDDLFATLCRVETEDGEKFTDDDIEFMGGESTITEVVGLGGVAQAAALPLQRSSGGSAAAMIARTEQMYRICVAEHPDLRIPVLDYRGTPVGFDVRAIAETGITPVLDIGIAGSGGGQIGGGVARAPLDPFLQAARALADD